MNKEYNEELEKEFDLLPKLSDKELDDFGEWLEQFRQEKELTQFEATTVKIINLERAMEAFGAKRNGKIVVEISGEDRNGRVEYKKPNKYEQFWNKYEQWQKRNERRAIARKHELQDYARMVEIMRVTEE